MRFAQIIIATLLLNLAAKIKSSETLVDRSVQVNTGRLPAHSAEQLTESFPMDTLGFTLRHPKGWFVERQGDRAWMVNAPSAQATGQALSGLAQIFVTVEHRRNHAEAVSRLREIASEYNAPVEYTTITSWPAIQRRVVTRKEQPGAVEADAQEQQILRITTAIAAGNLVIRAEARMPPNIGVQAEQQVLAIESGIAIRDAGSAADAKRAIEELRAAPKLSPSAPPPSRVKPASSMQLKGKSARSQRVLEGARARSEEETSGTAAPVISGGFASEPEIAVSTDGQKIVVSQQFNFATSNDGGLSFPTTGSFPSSDGGDASLAYGKSGNFYEGTIWRTSSALNVSTDSGKTFAFRAYAFTCPSTGANQCGFTRGNPPTPLPDQEHIAADRFHASASGGDQVYFAWRQGNGNIGVACSTDSGQNFGTPNFTPGDFPRITVGQDGFVYVVYINGSNVTLNKYGSCQTGLTVQSGFPITIANGISVACPVPGLDRCDNGNVLSSPTVAVDDNNANHIYVAYAQSISGGENVVLQDSTDSGSTWSSSRAVTLNSNRTARRFMPWLCTTGGLANVTWYDRRAATSTQNDLTDYYGATVGLNSSGSIGTPTEFQLNAAGSADAQCLAGKPVDSTQSWPNGSRAKADSTTCSKVEQPQLGGRCQHNPPNVKTDSLQPCNFSAVINSCPVNETCQTAGGRPKYGDYNGNACGSDKLYAIWASATPPPGQTPSGNVDLYFTTFSLKPPVCSISFSCPVPTGAPPIYTIRCPQEVDFWLEYADSHRQFLANSDHYSSVASGYNDGVLACNSGTTTCAYFSIYKDKSQWCPAPSSGPNLPYPKCCKACREAGGDCHHDTKTGGCSCQ